jgi:hypothetical protein
MKNKHDSIIFFEILPLLLTCSPHLVLWLSQNCLSRTKIGKMISVLPIIPFFFFCQLHIHYKKYDYFFNFQCETKGFILEIQQEKKRLYIGKLKY